MKITSFFIFLSITCFAQFGQTEDPDNFSVRNNKLIWQKSYPLYDLNYLDEQLKTHNFTSNLDIVDYKKSAFSPYTKIIADNLPQYARNDFKAFIVIDFFDGNYRVTISDITFPDFVVNEYYNGMKVDNGRGALDYYILKNGGTIKSDTASRNVLDSFDISFSDIFDAMVE